MRWFRRKKIAEDLKTVTEVAGDQLAPGAGAYYVSQTRKKKKAAQLGAAPDANRPPLRAKR